MEKDQTTIWSLEFQFSSHRTSAVTLLNAENAFFFRYKDEKTTKGGLSSYEISAN